LIPALSNIEQKQGWPWTEGSQSVSILETAKTEWPRLTIVTPSYNQGRFIEETIRSVLLQNYPNLEYIIIDGGSNDGTLEIIKKYEPWIAYWVSEPDKGQSDAINKGFQKATGLYGNWINSDDLLEKDALWSIVQKIDLKEEKAVFLGDYKEIEYSGELKRNSRSEIRKLEELVDIEGHWRNSKSSPIGQQSTFFPVKLFKDVGMLNTDNHFSMDYELWGRFLIAGAVFVPVHKTLGAFRVYDGQKISDRHITTKSLIHTASELIADCPEWGKSKKRFYRRLLLRYAVKYYYGHLRSIIGIRRRIKSIFRRTGIREQRTEIRDQESENRDKIEK
jgi:glycosyltransferase involved in cell wall biosynthesis